MSDDAVDLFRQIGLAQHARDFHGSRPIEHRVDAGHVKPIEEPPGVTDALTGREPEQPAPPRPTLLRRLLSSRARLEREDCARGEHWMSWWRWRAIAMPTGTVTPMAWTRWWSVCVVCRREYRVDAEMDPPRFSWRRPWLAFRTRPRW